MPSLAGVPPAEKDRKASLVDVEPVFHEQKDEDFVSASIFAAVFSPAVLPLVLVVALMVAVACCCMQIDATQRRYPVFVSQIFASR